MVGGNFTCGMVVVNPRAENYPIAARLSLFLPAVYLKSIIGLQERDA